MLSSDLHRQVYCPPSFGGGGDLELPPLPRGYERRPDSALLMPGAGVGVGQGGNLWTKPFPLVPLTISGLVYGFYADRMTSTGQGSAITAAEDLSGNGGAVSGALITQPFTADFDIFNGHASGLIETGGHFDPASAPLYAAATGNDPNWYAIAGIRLLTNSVDNTFFGWGNSATTARHTSFSIGGTRDQRNRRVDDGNNGSTVFVSNFNIGPEPTTYEFWITGSGAGTTVNMSYGGMTHVLSGNPQNVGVATMNLFSVGATITAGVFSALSRFWIRFLWVYNVVPSANDRSRLRVWAANDSFQAFH